jgi:hypothetical protein
MACFHGTAACGIRAFNTLKTGLIAPAQSGDASRGARLRRLEFFPAEDDA